MPSLYRLDIENAFHAVHSTLLNSIELHGWDRSTPMNHSLHRADIRTHARIVAISLSAATAIVIGALQVKLAALPSSHDGWANAGVIKAPQRAVYSIGEHPLVR
jgi:hypothetical protein